LLGHGVLPAGDPITISFKLDSDDLLTLTLHRVVAGHPGRAVTLYPLVHSHNQLSPNPAWAISKKPLCPASTYRVQAVLRLAGKTTPVQWDFTTVADAPAGAACAQ
jgi:hypothetical protein